MFCGLKSKFKLNFFEISKPFLNNIFIGFLIFFLLWLKKTFVTYSKFSGLLKFIKGGLGLKIKRELNTFGFGKKELGLISIIFSILNFQLASIDKLP